MAHDDAAGAVRRTPRPTEDTCRAYDVDGETVRVHGGKPLDEAGQAALGDIVRAATAKLAGEHPNLGVTQELIMAGLAANRAIHDGEVRGGCTIQDGAKVKARLKAAIGAARDALGSERRPVVLLRADDCDCGPPYADCQHGPEPVDALDLAVWLHAEAKWQLDEMRLDVEKYRDYLKMANRTTERRGHERDAARADRDRLKFLNGEAEGTIERALAELRERTAGRDALQARVAELEGSVGHHATMRGDAVAQREMLKTRIDAALAVCDEYPAGWNAPTLAHDRVRAALQGDQPTEPDERLAGMARPAEGVQLIADAFGIAPAEAAAQLRDAIRAAARSDLDEPGQPTGEADRA
jgi:hypothetical protein